MMTLATSKPAAGLLFEINLVLENPTESSLQDNKLVFVSFLELVGL